MRLEEGRGHGGGRGKKADFILSAMQRLKLKLHFKTCTHLKVNLQSEPMARKSAIRLCELPSALSWNTAPAALSWNTEPSSVHYERRSFLKLNKICHFARQNSTWLSASFRIKARIFPVASKAPRGLASSRSLPIPIWPSHTSFLDVRQTHTDTLIVGSLLPPPSRIPFPG